MSDVLTKETDARFWASTGYKPGTKLDPNDPHDRAMMKTWMDTYAKVKAEDAAGRLHLTYNHPDVAKDLSDAALAGAAMGAHLDAAATAPDAATKQHHERAAAAAGDIFDSAITAGLHKQPPTASPQVMHAAATDVHAAAGLPPPQPPAFDRSHPVHASETARPAHDDLARPERGTAAVKSPTRGSEWVSVLQTGRAAQRAGDAHGRARPVHPTIPPERLAAVRAQARQRALERAEREHEARFFGVVQLPSGEVEDYAFPSYEALMEWYHQNLAAGAAGAYYAAYNRDAPIWPDAISDGFGGEPTVVDAAALPEPPMIPPEQVPPPPARDAGVSPDAVPDQAPSAAPAAPAWTPPPSPAPVHAARGRDWKSLLPIGAAIVAGGAILYFTMHGSKGGGGGSGRSRARRRPPMPGIGP